MRLGGQTESFQNVRYTSKRTEQFVKIFLPIFDTKSHCTFMVCAGSAWIRNCCAFCRIRLKFCQTRRISTQDGALRHGHQSAALLVGEKWRTCRHVFKCRCGVFVAIFLTFIVYAMYRNFGKQCVVKIM